MILSDEVYEHLVYAPAVHVRPALLPGLAERTVTVGSAGKTLGFTGWKVGWVLAAPPLREAVQRAHQFITFATASPLQEASPWASSCRRPGSRAFGRSTGRDGIGCHAGLTLPRGCGAVAAEGSYFALADLRPLGVVDDVAFCRWLTTEVGVAAIPLSPFFDPAGPPPPPMARFAFCKRPTRCWTLAVDDGAAGE